MIDRILSSDQKKGPVEWIVGAIHCDLPLGHRLKQRCLGPGSGTIDFVRKNDRGKHRARPKLEFRRFRIEDGCASNVVGQEVRCALDSFEWGTDALRQ